MPIPYDEKSERSLPWHTTFIGQHMQHNFWLYAVVDRVMKENPQIESIVEIGTGSGALTTVLGLWGIKRGIQVLSIDNVCRHDQTLLRHLGVHFWFGDEFSDEAERKILSVVNNKPTWLYCDGGCKRDEFRKFAPLIPKGSVISAHDLDNEFSIKVDAVDYIPGIVTPYREEWWNELNIQLALFHRS